MKKLLLIFILLTSSIFAQTEETFYLPFVIKSEDGSEPPQSAPETGDTLIAPTNFAITPAVESVILNWTNTDATRTGTAVYRRPIGGAFVRITEINTPGDTTYTDVITSQYEYTLKSFNSSTRSEASDTVLGDPYNAQAAPSNLVAVASSYTQATITFDVSGTPTINYVYRSTDGTTYALHDSTALTTYVDTINDASIVYWKLKSKNSDAVVSSYSPVVSLSRTSVLAPPSSLAATAGAAKVDLTWTCNNYGTPLLTDSFADTTNWTAVYASTYGDQFDIAGGKAKLTRRSATGQWVSIVDTVGGLTVGQTYTYRYDYTKGTSQSAAVDFSDLITGYGAYGTIDYYDADGTYRKVFTATNDSIVIANQIIAIDSGDYGYFDNAFLAPANLQSFRSTYVWHRISPSLNYTFLDSVNAYVTNYTHNVDTTAQIDYKVQDSDTLGNVTTFSNVASATPTSVSALSAPYNADVSNSGGNLIISWNDTNSTASGLSWEIQDSTSAHGWTIIDTSTSKSYTHSVGYDSTVSYRVKTLTASLQSDYSNEATGTTDGTGYLGDDYYVSSTGNDYNDGLSSSSPWKTIGKVNSYNFQTGDKVYFKGGDQFSDATLTIDREIYVGSYDGQAIIGDSLGSLAQTIYITADNVTIDGLKIFGANIIDQEAVYIWSDGVKVTNCNIVGGRKSVYRGRGIAFVNPQSGEVSYCEVSYFTRGITASIPQNLEIHHNEIHHNYIWDVENDVTAGYANSGGIGVQFTINNITEPLPEMNYTVNVHHNEFYAFEHSTGFGGNEAIFEYNYVHSPLDERTYRGGVKHGTVGKVFDDYSATTFRAGIVIRYNVVSDMRKYGLPGYTYERDGTISSTNNGLPRPLYKEGRSDGSDFGDTPDEVPDALIGGLGYGDIDIHNNIIYNFDHQFFGKGRTTSRSDDPAYNSKIAYNTIYNGNQDEFRGAGLIYMIPTPSTVEIQNNILHFDEANSGVPAIFASYADFKSEHNIFVNRSGYSTSYSSSADYAIYDNGGTNRVDPTDTDYYSTNPAFEDVADSVFLPNVGVDGVYVPKFLLTAGSPAINQAVTIGNDNSGRSIDGYDIFGNPRSTPDIGAIEYGVTSGNPVLASLTETSNTGTGITLGVTVTPNGSTTSLTLKYSYTSGSLTNQVLVSSDADGVETKALTNLTSGNTLYYQWTAANGNGTVSTAEQSVALGASTEITIQVAADTSDGRYYQVAEAPRGTAFDEFQTSVTVSAIRLGDDTNGGGAPVHDGWFVFADLGIPSGATIDSAYLIFKAKYNGGSPTLQIFAEDAATPTTISDGDEATYLTITKTTNYTAWIPTQWQQNVTYNTPDITDVIQELVTSYSGLDATAIIVWDNGSATDESINTFDYGDVPADAAKIYIKYTWLETDYLDDGLTSTEIDNIIISLANAGATDQVIDLRGNDARTSASDAAFATLIAADNIIKEDL